MKTAALLVPVLAIGAAVGWLAPDATEGSVEAARPARTDSAPSQPGLAQPAKAQWLAGEQSLQRHADGHFYATVTIADQDVRMLVDTGASIVALTGADAEAIGIAWQPGDVRQVGEGASGPVFGVRAVIERLAVGDLEARNVDAIIVPEGLGISLLGQSYLRSVGRVEVHGDTMVLGG